MFDTELFDKKIEESGLKIGYIVEKLGLSRNGFDLKRKGKTPFRAAEIYVLCDLLNLTEPEKTQIFYADKVGR